MRYRMGDLVELVTETNSDLKYGLDDIVGVTLEKQMIPTIANLTQTNLDDFIVVHPKDFVYNPRTHGKKIGLGFNTTDRCFISTWNNNTFRVKPEMSDAIIPEFLYMHFLRERWDKEACFNAWGSSTVVLLWSSFCDMKINVPPISEQRKIVHDYKVITDRIELLRRMNENLEEQAQTIYKSWFETYDPFNGEMPADWFETTIGDLSSDVICGKTPPTDAVENYGGQTPFITIPDMHGSVYVVNTERTLSEIGVATQSNKTLPENSICVSCIATVGLVCLTAEPSQTNQQINSIVCKPDVSPFYVYLKMRTMEDHLKALGAGGSATLNVNKTLFSKIKILYPDKNIIKRFHEIVSPIFSTIRQYQLEMQRLYSLSNMIMSNIQRIAS